MSKHNAATIYVYVKGHGGQYAYMILNHKYEPLYKSNRCITDVNPIALYADWQAMIASLEYINEHKGKANFPDLPVVTVFTSFENNYHVAAGIKQARSKDIKEMLREFNEAKKKLARDKSTIGTNGPDDSVKVLADSDSPYMLEVIAMFSKRPKLR
jgi:hypothetical protein